MIRPCKTVSTWMDPSPMDPADRAHILEAIETALAGAPAVAVGTVTLAGDPPLLTPGDKLLVHRDGSHLGTCGDSAADAAVIEAAVDAFEAMPRVTMQTLYLGREGQATARRSQARPGDAEVMLQLFEAPARLVIVGGGHVGLALARFGELLGFSVTVIDDRPEFANRERFPMADEVIAADAGDALDALALDASASVVLVSRGHRQDEEALRHAVGRGAGYVGMIGSRRRTATVLRHLLEEGLAPADLEAVSTPIGLDIGAETPEEIAVSILAEVVMLRRGGAGGRMKAQRADLAAD